MSHLWWRPSEVESRARRKEGEVKGGGLLSFIGREARARCDLVRSVWKLGESALCVVVLWLWDFGNLRFGSGLCGWLIKLGAGLPLRLTGFSCCQNHCLGIGRTSSRRGEEAREVGVFKFAAR